jgi:hypothetical protein
MIYLDREKVEFARTKEEFEGAYLSLTNEMYTTFKAKGATRDTGAPIHHRMSPASMVALAQAKMRRIETLTSTAGWEENDGLLDKVVEECGDVANYNLFIAALCLMLQKEKKL